ncbi:DUF1836 domain-containing protein [Acidaminobacterium chupaoyuni]
MEEQMLTQELEQFLNSMETPFLPRWEALPELELYMDQILVFMEKYLQLFAGDKEKVLTPAMVNNYVKLGLLPPPVKKKYSRGHVARLMTICMLKQILPISAISYLMSRWKEGAEMEATFNGLVEGQVDALQETAQQTRLRLEESGEADELARLALYLSAQANAQRILADRITALLQAQEMTQAQAAEPAKKK